MQFWIGARLIGNNDYSSAGFIIELIDNDT